MAPIDDGHAVHYTALTRGTPVYSSDEQQVGTVVEVLEEFHAYPGARLVGALRDSAAANDARATAALAGRIASALVSRSFRQHADDWEVHEDERETVPDVLPPSLGRGEGHRPYFETLIVTGAPAERWMSGRLSGYTERVTRVRTCSVTVLVLDHGPFRSKGTTIGCATHGLTEVVCIATSL